MFGMLRRLTAVLAALILIGCAERSRAAEPAYDLVIRHGQIVDGSGNPWFHGDVAIRGDRLVAVGRVPGRSQIEPLGPWLDSHTRNTSEIRGLSPSPCKKQSA